MANWLVKSEPEDWSWQDQLGVPSEPWDGVRNRQAQNNMRAMAEGDQVLFYHSGKAREIVGLCRVSRAAYPDPTDESGVFCLVDLAAVCSAAAAVSLKAIKDVPSLAHLALVRQPRLSVMPIDDDAFSTLCSMAGIKA